jgi:phytoene dehydrogenase-like protein
VGNNDVIIIGAGHNSLVAAGYLAKAGRRVLVLEKRSVVGGTATTEEIFPGFKISPCADTAGYLSDEVKADLKLDSQVEFIPLDPIASSPEPDGTHLTIWRDTAKTVREIERFSPADAAKYPEFVKQMTKIAGVVEGLLKLTPMDLPTVTLSDLRAALSLAGPALKLGRKNIGELMRVLPTPVEDLLNEWFESDVLKGAIAASAVKDVTWGPQETGTTFTFLYNWALSDTGLFRSASLVKGGIGQLSKAMAETARGFGAEIRTDAEVKSINAENGKVTGVTLANGETLQAGAVVSGASPRTTFLDLLNPRSLDVSFVRHAQNIKYRGSASRMHFTLSGLPEFPALAGGETEGYLRGPIQIAPSITYLQRAFDHTKYGRSSSAPYLDIVIPTVADPSLAPSGKHIMSVTVKYTPYALRDGDWASKGEEIAKLVVDTITEYAPNFRGLIVDQRLITPVDLESVYDLPEGNINHGEMTLDQFFHMRPIPGYARYRTPVEGVYVCGPGCHPGGGVTGLPGRNAAREILKDAK